MSTYVACGFVRVRAYVFVHVRGKAYTVVASDHVAAMMEEELEGGYEIEDRQGAGLGGQGVWGGVAREVEDGGVRGTL